MNLRAAEPQRPRIADYGFLSDCRTSVLVDRRGSVDWWCLPRFDGASVFGRLLGPDAGHWSVRPTGVFTTTRAYLDDTLVLRSVHTTPDGAVAVTDALALEPGARGHEIGLRSPRVLLRTVEGLSGRVPMTTELRPRMEYGRTEPHLRDLDGRVEAWAGPVRLVCTGPIAWELADGAATSTFAVRSGETVQLRLTASPAFPSEDSDGTADAASIADTIAAWRSWAAEHTAYDGDFPAEVRHSSLVLQGLTYAPSGAVIAAATTSLPESLGGADTWDYRFAWLRDLSLTARALWVAACPSEPRRLFDWFAAAAGHIGDDPVQIVYGVEGERDLTERPLPHLPGHRDSRPVRVGNAAWQQRQLDVLGEVLGAAHLMRDSMDEVSPAVADVLVTLADRAADSWDEPDAGMWEARDAERHYTSSKVMCWVALDRAIDMAPRLRAEHRVPHWRAAAATIRSAVLERAWSTALGAYAGAFDSDELDASVLLLPLVGFLPMADERMAATVEIIATRLGSDGLVRRWASDGSGFLLCTYWLVECLALGGHADRAEKLFRHASSHANDLGLLAEEADPRTGEALGNVPQAFSHVGLINAAWRLAHPGTPEPLGSAQSAGRA